MLSVFNEGEACRQACILYLPSYSRHIFRHVTDRHDNGSTRGINVFHVSNFFLLILPIFEADEMRVELMRLYPNHVCQR